MHRFKNGFSQDWGDFSFVFRKHAVTNLCNERGFAMAQATDSQLYQSKISSVENPDF